eukprot:SAG31_NODE_4782_length_2958_cov_1.792585_1_plen_70_part_00
MKIVFMLLLNLVQLPDTRGIVPRYGTGTGTLLIDRSKFREHDRGVLRAPSARQLYTVYSCTRMRQLSGY